MVCRLSSCLRSHASHLYRCISKRCYLYSIVLLSTLSITLSQFPFCCTLYIAARSTFSKSLEFYSLLCFLFFLIFFLFLRTLVSCSNCIMFWSRSILSCTPFSAMAGPIKMQHNTLCLVFVVAASAVTCANATLTLIRIEDSMPGAAAVSSVSVSCTLSRGTNTYDLGTKVLTPGTFDDVLFQNDMSGTQEVSCNFIWINADLRNPSVPAII